MSTDLYVAASAQIAIDRRMEAIANNIANANTAGYRAAGVKFEATMAKVGEENVAFASPGTVYIVRDSGPVNYTGNSLDVAVDGDGWLAMQTPNGTAYTRDGRMHITAFGQLQSVAGYPMLDLGGGPITIDPSAGPVTIGENGTISQNGKPIGGLGLFLIPKDAALARQDNSGVVPSKPAEPVEDFTANSIRQGYVEGSNVNPILEMTRLIEVSRAFDQAATAIDQSDNMSQEAIRTLSPAGG
jgi:flagellar basal-body rod protein FlgF